MMKCQRYVFLLSSGQLADSPMSTRLDAQAHRLICHHCRAFTRNNARLDQIMATQRDRLMQPDPADPPGALPGDRGAPRR